MTLIWPCLLSATTTTSFSSTGAPAGAKSVACHSRAAGGAATPWTR
jgi:hypothetical protein